MLGTIMESDHVQRMQLAADLRRARPEDAGALAKLLTAAFFDDPIMEFMVRPGVRRAAALEMMFHRLLSERDIPQGEVWMSGDGVACTIWLPPGAKLSPPGLLGQLRIILFFSKVCGWSRLARGGALADAMEKNHPREPHFYLAFMAVEPKYQGAGLGSAILEATLKRIDAVGAASYLENSNPRNERLYTRAGFVAQKDIAPKGAPPLIAMLRPAKS